MNIRYRVQRYYEDLKNVASDAFVLRQSFGSIPVAYFRAQRNVGDELNPYLIPRISSRSIVPVSSRHYRHLRAVGSLLQRANKNSVIWGAGSMWPVGLRAVDPKAVYAIRGKLTLRLLESSGHGKLSVPLGDPALLMPRFYPRQSQDISSEIGVVPHFVDLDLISDWMQETPREYARLISVDRDPENFIDEISQCKFVISTSLHGGILSDAYGIPNVIARVSDNIAGGEFKFSDYYSTTDHPHTSRLEIRDKPSFLSLLDSVDSRAAVHECVENLDDLISEFPHKEF